MYDKIIIGAGLYGLYAALYCAKKGQNVLVIEREQGPFMRATYINQARVHGISLSKKYIYGNEVGSLL